MNAFRRFAHPKLEAALAVGLGTDRVQTKTVRADSSATAISP